MRRVLAVAAIAASTLLIGGASSALAQDPEETVPPAFAPPPAGDVIDEASAEAFAENYGNRNAGRFLRSDRRRVRVFDVNAECLENPVVADRFGCVFTLRAIVISRSRGWDDWGHSSKAHRSSRGDDDRKHGRKHRRKFRVREYGCLGLLNVTGGVGVTPTVQLRAIECARAPRDDREVVEPVV